MTKTRPFVEGYKLPDRFNTAKMKYSLECSLFHTHSHHLAVPYEINSSRVTHTDGPTVSKLIHINLYRKILCLKSDWRDEDSLRKSKRRGKKLWRMKGTLYKVGLVSGFKCWTVQNVYNMVNMVTQDWQMHSGWVFNHILMHMLMWPCAAELLKLH